ncbi:four-helix bundle copper-binding protein [Halosegnis marinus]|uniref:Four-helix bundle copper-binding protein n=2 Tax=Halosegnis marinus TaxID=3034023 RepID=A0ABD5ZPX1_9EURY|nr:four-helix bundle copper-binding protein [Halosegnis sp. DT85]
MTQPRQQAGGYGTIGPMEQQQGTVTGQGFPAPGPDITLEEAISEEMRVVLHDFVESANVAEWCADRCLDEQGMAECARLCRDVADIARLNVELLARDSAFGAELAEVFVVAAEAAARECARHPTKHCQECAEVLPRAARATRKMLASFEQGGQIQPGQGIGQF